MVVSTTKLGALLVGITTLAVLAVRVLAAVFVPNEEVVFGTMHSDRQSDLLLGIYALDITRNLFSPLVSDHFDNNSPVWSPDGKWVAFVSNRGAGTSKIYLMDANGGSVRRLTDSDYKEDAPSWSPDGRFVAFWLEDRDDAPTFKAESVHTGLTIIDVESGQMRRLVPGWVDDVMRSGWSPDGRRIVFITRGELFLVNTDGTDLHPLIDFRADAFSAPSWSPDGTQIVFQAYSPKGFPQIYRVNADGSALRQLTDAPGSSANPAWSSDGQSILFSSFRDANDELYIMNRDGTHQQRLTWSEDSDYRPVWRP